MGNIYPEDAAGILWVVGRDLVSILMYGRHVLQMLL